MLPGYDEQYSNWKYLSVMKLNDFSKSSGVESFTQVSDTIEISKMLEN